MTEWSCKRQWNQSSSHHTDTHTLCKSLIIRLLYVYHLILSSLGCNFTCSTTQFFHWLLTIIQTFPFVSYFICSAWWRHRETLQNPSVGRRRLLHCTPNDIQVKFITFYRYKATLSINNGKLSPIFIGHRTLQELVEHYSKDSDGLCVNLRLACVQVSVIATRRLKLELLAGIGFCILITSYTKSFSEYMIPWVNA